MCIIQSLDIRVSTLGAQVHIGVLTVKMHLYIPVLTLGEHRHIVRWAIRVHLYVRYGSSTLALGVYVHVGDGVRVWS